MMNSDTKKEIFLHINEEVSITPINKNNKKLNEKDNKDKPKKDVILTEYEIDSFRDKTNILNG